MGKRRFVPGFQRVDHQAAIELAARGHFGTQALVAPVFSQTLASSCFQGSPIPHVNPLADHFPRVWAAEHEIDGDD